MTEVFEADEIYLVVRGDLARLVGLRDEPSGPLPKLSALAHVHVSGPWNRVEPADWPAHVRAVADAPDWPALDARWAAEG